MIGPRSARKIVGCRGACPCAQKMPVRLGLDATSRCLRLRTAATTTFSMSKSVAIIGAGVSGLTCAVLFAERGYRTAIFAEEIGQRTTSAAAGALWFPY